MANNSVLDRSWLEEFGGLLGLRVTDFQKNHGLDDDDLFLYSYPCDEELRGVGTRGIFLGHFFPWDGLNNAIVSQTAGFEFWPTLVQGSAASYENLDNYQTGIHDYFKFLKFGFGRASDILSMHIRRGRIERHHAVKVVRTLEGQFPSSYLDKSLDDILSPLGISVARFSTICDDFTNYDLFETDRQGELVRDGAGNLIKLNYDNPPPS
jgi:hypothetical protein